MDSRPYFLFQRLLEWLSSLTKRASSVVLRLFCALQAYWRHWSSTPNSRRTSVGSSRYFSANGVESQVINPSNVNVTPVLPIHTAHVQVAGSSRLRTGRSTYTTTQHGNPVPHIPHSGSVVNGELVAPDSNQVDVRVRMTSADGVKRYDRNIRLSPKVEIQYIPASTTTFEERIPDHVTRTGWARTVHPEGAVYFRHEQRGIYTDANIRDLRIFNIISRAIEIIVESARKADPPIETGPDVQLVIELQLYKDEPDESRQHGMGHKSRTKGVSKDKSKTTISDDPSKNRSKSKDEGDTEAKSKPICSYYFVNHLRRCLLWPKEFKDVSSRLFYHVKGIKSWDHVRHAMERQYWYHCELFPDSLCIHPPSKCPRASQSARSLADELKQIIMHASGDALTSKTSLVPFDKEELGKLLELTDHIRDSFETSEVSPCVKVFLARLMRTFAHARFFNFHGEVGARLDADQTVYNFTERRPSVLLYLISWLLFRAPHVHLKTLKTIWVDQTINYVPWTKFLDKLNSEWQELVLYATVILNANVAFLAIPGVSANGAPTGPQICSYISVAASVGAVITGLILMRQNRTKHRDTAGDAAAFMMRMDRSTFGMETIAILFSMPYGMLMWSVISFVCAFCIVMFDGTDLTTRLLLGFVGILVLLFTFWTVLYAYREDESKPARPQRTVTSKKKPDHFGAHQGKPEFQLEENGGSSTGSLTRAHMPQAQVPHVQHADARGNVRSPCLPAIAMLDPQTSMPEPTSAEISHTA